MRKNRYFFFGFVFLICFLLYSGCLVDAAEGFTIKGTVLSFYNGTETAVQTPKKVKIIGKRAFAENKKIKKITIGSGVTAIRTAAFKNCTKLKTVAIPADVRKIADNAFAGCRKVVILTEKGTYAWKYAKKHKIARRSKSAGQAKESFYNITGIECYLYTAGTYPCEAQKKMVQDPADFDWLYEMLMQFNSGRPAEETDMIDGGQTLRVIIGFDDKENRIITCNEGAYKENGMVNRLADGMNIQDFWDTVEYEAVKEMI